MSNIEPGYFKTQEGVSPTLEFDTKQKGPGTPVPDVINGGVQTGCANASDKLHLAFDWGAAGSNNGNLKGQTIAAPGFSRTQYYEYDATNRLKIAVEGAPAPGAGAGVADLPGDHELVPRV